MTEQQAIDKLKALAQNEDTQMAHILSNVVLCQFLTARGYKDLVDAYVAVGKRH